MPEQTSVIILGAGPSGLAAAGCLREKGVPFVVVERAGAVGSTWRNHYERLHLHTIKQFSALPGLPWPSTVPMYPSRAEVVAYLERYAAKFRIEPRFGLDVTSARHDGARWVVRAGAEEIHAGALVVATGYNRVPKQPTWPGQSTFRGEIIHSSAYKNGAAWKGKRALVVGIGNSGGEIAIDLWEHGAETAISVRSPVHVVPRDLFGLPAQVNSLFMLGRLRRRSPIGSPTPSSAASSAIFLAMASIAPRSARCRRCSRPGVFRSSTWARSSWSSRAGSGSSRGRAS